MRHEAGQEEPMREALQLGAQATPDFVSRNLPDDALTLQAVLLLAPEDARAWYYLGNFWFDKRQYADAIACWERSAALDATFPTVWRNLALARFNKQQKAPEALECMEKAFSLDASDARVLMELDQLYKKLGHSDEQDSECWTYPTSLSPR
jgi:tetratricopeptide (TPR) repeat protein